MAEFLSVDCRENLSYGRGRLRFRLDAKLCGMNLTIIVCLNVLLRIVQILWYVKKVWKIM